MTEEVVTSSAQNHFARYSHIESELIIDGCQPNQLPDLSVMIPTFRRPQLLKEAIESVVNQTAHGINIEIVVVDNDAETNSSELASLVESFFPNNIRLFRNKENIGMFGNWNRCIELARAPKLTILNDDDLLHPDFINVVKCYLSSDALISCYSKRFSIASELTNLIKNSYNAISLQLIELTSFDLFLGMWTNGSLGTILDKKKSYDIGGIDEKLFPISDWVFLYNYQKKNKLLVIDAPLAFFRFAENESMNISTIQKDISVGDYFRRKVSKKESTLTKKIVYKSIAHIIKAKKIISAKEKNKLYNAADECRKNGLNLQIQYLLACIPIFRLRRIYIVMKALIK